MDRRSFLAALAGVGAARFFCPSGAHGAVTPAVTVPMTAAPVAAASTRPDLTWLMEEALRLLSENLTSVHLDRYAVWGDSSLRRKLGDSAFVRPPMRFVPFGPMRLFEPPIVVTLNEHTGVKVDVSPLDLGVAREEFTDKYLKPAMHFMANRIWRSSEKTRHGKHLLVTAPLPLPPLPGVDVLHLCRGGINLRFVTGYDCPTDAITFRFDVLHGIAEL